MENLKMTLAMIMIMNPTSEQKNQIYSLVCILKFHIYAHLKKTKKNEPVKVETSKGTTES